MYNIQIHKVHAVVFSLSQTSVKYPQSEDSWRKPTNSTCKYMHNTYKYEHRTVDLLTYIFDIFAKMHTLSLLHNVALPMLYA